jgi:hypothetical protein
MSEDITIGTGTETILGSHEDAVAYVDTMLGDRYDAWLAATTDEAKAQKKSLVNAVRFFNSMTWGSDYDTLAKRDAFTLNGVPVFQNAQYELAVLIYEDSELTDEEQGSNVQALKAGSAGIAFFNQTTKTADPLPPVVMRLVGGYLAASRSRGPVGGGGQSGSCVNPFSTCSDDDRSEPW